jgi:hypothetical protein
MSLKRISTFLNAAGLVLDALGLFLPWAEWNWAPGGFAGPGPYPKRGVDMPLGVLALVLWLVAIVSWVLFMVKGQKLLLGFVMAGGIVTMICSLASMTNPGAFLSSSLVWTASYGEYVSFAGGILILAGATFSSLT